MSNKGKGASLMAQMGFADMGDMEKAIYGDLEGDEELEAELARLQGKDVSAKVSTGAKRENLDALVSSTVKDIDDEDISDVDENDEELLAELRGISTDTDTEPPSAKRAPSPLPAVPSSSIVSQLEERLQMYQEAQQHAKTSGDSSKARRLDRGIKTISDLLKKAKAGKAVSEDDIPPPVHASPSHNPPASPPEHLDTPTDIIIPTRDASPPPAPPTESKPFDEKTHAMLVSRRNQYKVAALKAKKAGDVDRARTYIKTSKQFDMVIQALEHGDPVDLSQMPPPPPSDADNPPGPTPVERESSQASANFHTEPEENIPEPTAEEKQKLFQAPEAAGSVMEALEQRLEKYKSTADGAKQEGNNSKARRMGRIVKQYEDAIKAYKAGKPVDYEGLPAPPGFPPIPVPQAATPTASPTKAAQAAAPAEPPTTPTQQQQPASRQSVKKSPSSRAEQQAQFLQQRQLEFKKAALAAKKKGDMGLAKKYLKMAKGFDPMIEASQAGLPVDLSQVPSLPGSKGADLTRSPIPAGSMGDGEGQEEEEGAPKADRNTMYKKLEQELINQIRTCTTNADHFTQLGDISNANNFDRMGQNSRKDLDALRNAFKHGDPVPRFHLENKEFSIVQSCTDLGDNDLEIIIARGINYSLPSGYQPKDLDTYVKWEFPYPNDEPQKGETDTCKHTNNPEYNQTFKLEINRKSRAFLRLLKSSKTAKFDIFYKRGFFKGDKLLGSASLKLQQLESQCIIHESYDLMDGRKSVGGKLELKIRVRHPFINKQVEEIKERWLVIDRFERSLDPEPPRNSVKVSGSQQTDYQSMEVLKYEKQLLDKQLARLQGKLSEAQTVTLQNNSKLLSEKIDQTKASIRAGGMTALKEYMAAVEKAATSYHQEAALLAKQGQRDKAQVLLNKKSIAEREADSIRSRLQKT